MSTTKTKKQPTAEQVSAALDKLAATTPASDELGAALAAQDNARVWTCACEKTFKTERGLSTHAKKCEQARALVATLAPLPASTLKDLRDALKQAAKGRRSATLSTLEGVAGVIETSERSAEALDVARYGATVAETRGFEAQAARFRAITSEPVGEQARALAETPTDAESAQESWDAQTHQDDEKSAQKRTEGFVCTFAECVHHSK